MTTYGTFDGSRLTKFTNATSLEKLALLHLKKTLHEEGLKLNNNGIIEYLQGWVEWSQETEDPCEKPEQMIDQAADTLCFSNIHFMNCNTRTQISSKDRDEVCRVITEKLNQPFKK